MAETFGQRLREARERANWTQEQMAFETQVPLSYVRRQERLSIDDGPYAILIRLCDALDISADELLGRKGSEVDRGR